MEDDRSREKALHLAICLIATIHREEWIGLNLRDKALLRTISEVMQKWEKQQKAEQEAA